MCNNLTKTNTREDKNSIDITNMFVYFTDLFACKIHRKKLKTSRQNSSSRLETIVLGRSCDDSQLRI